MGRGGGGGDLGRGPGGQARGGCSARTLGFVHTAAHQGRAKLRRGSNLGGAHAPAQDVVSGRCRAWTQAHAGGAAGSASAGGARVGCFGGSVGGGCGASPVPQAASRASVRPWRASPGGGVVWAVGAGPAAFGDGDPGGPPLAASGVGASATAVESWRGAEALTGAAASSDKVGPASRGLASLRAGAPRDTGTVSSGGGSPVGGGGGGGTASDAFAGRRRHTHGGKPPAASGHGGASGSPSPPQGG